MMSQPGRMVEPSVSHSSLDVDQPMMVDALAQPWDDFEAKQSDPVGGLSASPESPATKTASTEFASKATSEPDPAASVQPVFEQMLPTTITISPESNGEPASSKGFLEIVQPSLFGLQVAVLSTSESIKSDLPGDVLSSPELPAEKMIASQLVSVSVSVSNLAGPLSRDQFSPAASVNRLKRKIGEGVPLDCGGTDSDLSDLSDDLSRCSGSPTDKKIRSQPRGEFIPASKTESTEALGSKSVDEATAELIREWSAIRRSTRIAETKGHTANTEVPSIRAPHSTRISSHIAKLEKYSAHATGEKKVTKASNRQSSQKKDSNNPIVDEVASLNSPMLTRLSRGATASKNGRVKATIKGKKPKGINKANKESKQKLSKLVTLNVGSSTLEGMLDSKPILEPEHTRTASKPSQKAQADLIPHHAAAEHDSASIPVQTNFTRTSACAHTISSSPSSVLGPMSTPPQLRRFTFPPTPDDTPGRNTTYTPCVPWRTPSPSEENHYEAQDQSDMQSPLVYQQSLYQQPQNVHHKIHQHQSGLQPQNVLDSLRLRELGEKRDLLPDIDSTQDVVPEPVILHDFSPQTMQRQKGATRSMLEKGNWPVDKHDHEMLRACAARLGPARDPATPKPDPSFQPEVWADGRQELCETLQYFRAYQGGGYATGGYARGFMFDKSAHARDYMDSMVVIARAGGGLVKDKISGERIIVSDRVEDSKVASLRNSMQYLNPVVIITGADNPNIPSKPPHAYCVLDYFKPTHIWSEKTKGKRILRYRFEKLDATKPSWWTPNDREEQIEHGSLHPTVHTCSQCSIASQQVYLQGWMCLQPICPMFWLLGPTSTNPMPHEPVETELEYDPCFLKQHVRWPNDKHVYSLASNNAELSGLSIVGEDCSLAYWLGMVCPECGRCNSRLSWTGWECGNSGCTWKRMPSHTFIPAQSIRDPFFPLTLGYTMSRDTHLPLVKLDVSFKDNYRINKYTIAGVDGFVAHLIANKTIVEEEGGPDQMFEELQKEDIGLRRRGLGSGMLKGESYTRHFLVNYGMPYKFIAATASRSFEGAARPINHTRTRLNWAARSVLAGTTINGAEDWNTHEFNEVLALGYFEQQRINYHDDGEFGLGPTIATLSLGAPGTMRMRLKTRHHTGVSTAGIYDDSPPLPGCASYSARLAASSSLATLKQTSPAAYRTRLKTLPKELKLKSGGTARDALTMTLAHGDVVIMHGAQMQRYYEHSVDHGGKLRFALTCRYIDPESLKAEDRPQYEVKADEGVYDGSLLPTAG